MVANAAVSRFMAASLAAVVVGIASTGTVWAQDIKIGFISAQSGPLAGIGGEQKRGLEIALAELGDRVGGRRAVIIPADTRSNANAAVEELGRLIDREKVDIIVGGTASNEVAGMVAPAAEAKKIFIGTNGGPNNFAGKDCSPYYFNAAFLNAQMDAGLGAFIAERGYKKLFLMAMDYQAGWDHVAAAKQGYTGAVVGSVFTPQAQLDYANEFAKVRASGADAVFAFYPGGAAVAFIKQWAQSGLPGQVQLFSNAGLTDPLLAPAQGDAIYGAIVSLPYAASLDNAANQKFVAAFRAKFGRDPSIYAAQQYDAMRLLDAAVTQTKGVLDDTTLRTAIAQAKFDSVRGRFAFYRNQMPIEDNYIFEVAKGGDGALSFKMLRDVKGEPDVDLAAGCPMK